MRRKREPRNHRIIIRLNSWEREMIDRALHIHSMQTGDLPPFASFVRGQAIRKAHALIQQWQKHPKSERLELEQEYSEIEDPQDTA